MSAGLGSRGSLDHCKYMTFDCRCTEQSNHRLPHLISLIGETRQGSAQRPSWSTFPEVGLVTWTASGSTAKHPDAWRFIKRRAKASSVILRATHYQRGADVASLLQVMLFLVLFRFARRINGVCASTCLKSRSQSRPLTNQGLARMWTSSRRMWAGTSARQLV